MPFIQTCPDPAIAATTDTFRWSTVAARSVPFAIIWWALTAGARHHGGWVPAVLLAAVASAALMPPVPLVWRELLTFVPFFLERSLLGSLDVAQRRPDPVCPSRRRSSIPLRLPAGLARVMLANTISLLPGTLGAGVDGDRLAAVPCARRARAEQHARDRGRRRRPSPGSSGRPC
ncbi:MAG: Na+/H+ antiporter subunit E [Gammaproteobacteria bacterium]|nr:Na+/H+ antiporter subunit E [Gammaproteobacteria bacterium]